MQSGGRNSFSYCAYRTLKRVTLMASSYQLVLCLAWWCTCFFYVQKMDIELVHETQGKQTTTKIFRLWWPSKYNEAQRKTNTCTHTSIKISLQNQWAKKEITFLALFIFSQNSGLIYSFGGIKIKGIFYSNHRNIVRNETTSY